ncbi:uncharacterized protein LOC123539618 [Mercenaria mercenaria]|uniref:uncharacterized protein LOC123539618 n=1 Tax=Mercenaria mercenaria TaxID=6596 RepID=UPI00234F5B4A|nr:uncharacterized protein LOC123539618 [Mercenaria mercenaria]XP_053389060.1 uncharacterized protein LOC123539618 [Mercenaria mercenaria]
MKASSDECTSIRIEDQTDTDGVDEVSTRESGIFTTWKQCIAEMDIPGINKLLDKELLPTASELNGACSAFKRRSPIVARICGKICKEIKNVSEDITSTWAAYPYPCKSKDEECNVIFVVYTKQPKCPNICFRDFRIYQRGESEFSEESKTVVSLDITPHDEDNQLIDIENLQMIIENNADTLLDKHSNINAITSGIKKSVGYMQNHHIQKRVLCVVIYVHVKGLIPLEEDPFPSYIDKYPTDVLEGDVTLFNKGPFDYREHVIMGLAIKASNMNSYGTLGGFVMSDKYGVCALTCCHCLFNENEISQINSNGGNLPVDLQNCTTVYQACRQESKSFGTVAEVIHDEKMDVALINVIDRFPESGEFPETDLETGDSNPPEFYSGRIREPNDIQRGTDVFKFGISTNFTKGRFNLPSKLVVLNKRFRRRVFKGQIEVISTDGSFAKEGDSGALIFLTERKRTFCLGLIVAGFTDGTVLATPIGKILTALECPNRLMSFRPVNRLSGDSGVVEMEVDDD